MRIKKTKLGKPDYEYVTVAKGNKVIVRIYHEPQYCVQIETAKDKQCYPLTFEQYNNYCDNAELTLRPNKAVVQKLMTQAKENAQKFADPNLKRFWTNVVHCYESRGAAES